MTIFGYFYLLLSLSGVLTTINRIGKPRQAVTSLEASSSLISTTILFLGLYFWGLR